MSNYYERNNRGITKKLGPVTAYADAVLAGYTGTREQWAQDMANLGQNATQVAQNAAITTELARQTAENAEQVAENTAEVRRLSDETAANTAKVAEDTAKSTRLAEETKQAAAQAKEDAEYAGAAADNFRVDTTLSEEGKAAEAKTTGEKFARLSEEIDSLASNDFNTIDLWEQGALSRDSGLVIDSASRIHTKSYISDVISRVYTKYPWVFCVYAYDSNGTYIGIWNGSEFVKGAYAWKDSLDFASVREHGYKYKLVLRRGDDAAITTEAYVNLHCSSRIYDEIKKITDEDALQNRIKGTTQNVAFNSDGRPSSITHTDSVGNVVRTDTYEYSQDTITETRTLANGESITVVTNIKTLTVEVK